MPALDSVDAGVTFSAPTDPFWLSRNRKSRHHYSGPTRTKPRFTGSRYTSTSSTRWRSAA